MEQTIECLDQDFTGLCFTNLVDFDALWGHRRNPQGYAEELEKFDVLLGQFLEKMKEDIQEQSRQLIWIQNIWIWQKRGSQL